MLPACCPSALAVAKNLFPNAEFLTANTPQSCLNYLDKKQADVCIMNTYMFGSLPDTGEYVQYTSTQNVTYTFLFSSTDNSTLVEIINKSLQQISDIDLNQTISNNLTSLQYEITLPPQ